jgi:hypothetical protein
MEPDLDQRAITSNTSAAKGNLSACGKRMVRFIPIRPTPQRTLAP